MEENTLWLKRRDALREALRNKDVWKPILDKNALHGNKFRDALRDALGDELWAKAKLHDRGNPLLAILREDALWEEFRRALRPEALLDALFETLQGGELRAEEENLWKTSLTMAFQIEYKEIAFGEA